ncbi:unnamed protein product [Amoebophrya sp. A120]|nr:unnamed protein product [Amoebophrya sp. A120]|eukprot:GSA120T00021955001.1
MSRFEGGKCCLFAFLVNSAIPVMAAVASGLHKEASSPHAVASATINYANGGRDRRRQHLDRVHGHLDLRQFAEDAATHSRPQSPTQKGRLDRNAQSRTTGPEEREATYSRPQSPTHSSPQSPIRSMVLGSLPIHSTVRDKNGNNDFEKQRSHMPRNWADPAPSSANCDYFYMFGSGSSSRRNSDEDHVGSGAASSSALLPMSRTPSSPRPPREVDAKRGPLSSILVLPDEPADLSLLAPFKLPPAFGLEDDSDFLDGPGAGG